MATRNLARTIIEPGRRYQSQSDRKFRTRRRRRRRIDEEGDVIGRNPHAAGLCVYHHDRRSPLLRWLQSHVGRPWNKVFSEFRQRYDVRTLKGRHAREHLLQEVVRYPLLRNGYYADFYVDGHGLLRRSQNARGKD